MVRLTHAFCSLVLVFLVCPSGLAASTQATYVASDGTMYAISPGNVKLGACGPIPGGYECTADSERVVSDGLAAAEVGFQIRGDGPAGHGAQTEHACGKK